MKSVFICVICLMDTNNYFVLLACLLMLYLVFH